ncbi:MAG: HlyD family efflux transporter periplasmic adaptor subunit [Gorillibacterium sp.]|nr:HlyD family efflux transporter periplasmic adaptor subunit [Gorillibacterium sp.]
MFRLRGKKWIAIVIAVLLLCGGGTYFLLNGSQAKGAAKAESKIVEATTGTIRQSVSGSSQLEPGNVQTVIAPAGGTIKTMNLKRNQDVKKGDLLLEIADPTLEINLQESQEKLTQLKKELLKLQDQAEHMVITAGTSGLLTLSNNVEVGGNVSDLMKIGTVSGSSTMIVTLPFPAEEAVQLVKGEEVDVAIDPFLLTKTGVIRSVSKVLKADESGATVLEVEIAITNDGSLGSGLKATGSISKDGREIVSTGSGTLEFSSETAVQAEAAGTIGELRLKTGDTVTAGAVIATITNDSLADDIADSQAAIERQKLVVTSNEDKVKEMIVKAPFDGVFSTDFVNQRINVLESYPAGAKIEANVQFGSVADLNNMQLAISVDELDLPNIKMGLKAEISVDSIERKVFAAEVTQVSSVGTTTNGVTSYDVVLSLKNETGELKNGMTATAEILIQDKKDITVLPIEALKRQAGKRYVTLQNADGTIDEQHEVETGISSKTFVEIVSGLNVGDKVVVPVTVKKETVGQDDIDAIRAMFESSGGFPGGGGGNFPGGTGGTGRTGGTGGTGRTGGTGGTGGTYGGMPGGN